MSLSLSESPEALAELAELVHALRGRINEAGRVLGRCECFDEEQRAEAHAILEALRHDSEFHARVLDALPAEAGHA